MTFSYIVNTPIDSGQGDDLHITANKINDNFDLIPSNYGDRNEYNIIFNSIFATFSNYALFGHTHSFTDIFGLTASFVTIPNYNIDITNINQSLIDLNTSISTIDLQRVTNIGNTTDNTIIVFNGVNNTNLYAEGIQINATSLSQTSGFVNGALELGDLNGGSGYGNFIVDAESSNTMGFNFQNSVNGLKQTNFILHPDYYTSGNCNNYIYFPYKEGNYSYTLATLEDIIITATPSLQEITNIGNTTSNSIIVENSTTIKSSMASDINDSYFFSQYNDNYASIGSNEFGSIITTSDVYGSSQLSSVALTISSADYGVQIEQGKLSLQSAVDQPFISMMGITGSTNITTDLLTGNRQQALPDKDGTFAMLDDIENESIIPLIVDGLAGTPITGGTTQTRSLIKSYLIPANTFAVGDIIEVWASGSKVGTATSWYVSLSKNTSNTLSGSTELVRSFSNNSSTIYMPLQRLINVNTSTSIRISNQTNTLEGATGVVMTTTTFDVSVDNYFLFSVTPATGGTGDVMNIERVMMTKSKYKTTV